MNPVRLLVVGGGGRGYGYARYATAHPGQARVVGVAEPRDVCRERLACEHAIPADRAYRDWDV
jgi:predicted dehydrogenase